MAYAVCSSIARARERFLSRKRGFTVAHSFSLSSAHRPDRRGWSGGAMVLGKLPVPGRPTIWITVGQGPTALAVGAGGGCLDIFTLIYPFFPLSPSLWETARYRLKYCLKGPLNQKPTNQPNPDRTEIHVLLQVIHPSQSTKGETTPYRCQRRYDIQTTLTLT